MQIDYLQSLFEAIHEGAVLVDKHGRIIDWNQGATTLFGYPKREVLGKSINLVYQQNYPFTKIIQEKNHQSQNHSDKFTEFCWKKIAGILWLSLSAKIFLFA